MTTSTFRSYQEITLTARDGSATYTVSPQDGYMSVEDYVHAIHPFHFTPFRLPSGEWVEAIKATRDGYVALCRDWENRELFLSRLHGYDLLVRAIAESDLKFGYFAELSQNRNHLTLKVDLVNRDTWHILGRASVRFTESGEIIWRVKTAPLAHSTDEVYQSIKAVEGLHLKALHYQKLMALWGNKLCWK